MSVRLECKKTIFILLQNTMLYIDKDVCYCYNKKHHSELTKEEIIEECRLFLLKKYGINGYARDKMYFEDLEYDKYLDDLTKLASNKEEFNKQINSVIKE